MNNIITLKTKVKKRFSIFQLMFSLILVVASATFCQAQVTPSVVISSNAINNSLCRGTAVTFTATPTNGGATPTYQWKKNGINAGTGATLTLNNILNNDAIIVVMTTSLSASSVTSTTATSNSITTTVNNLPSVVSTTPANVSSCSSTGSATINAVPSTGSVIDWYASTSYGTPLLTSSNSYTTPNISATTTYYAVARDTFTGCQSNGTTAQSMAINWGPNLAYIQTTKPVTGSFTIEFWLNTTGLSSAGCSSWRCGEGIVSANTSASNNDFGITMYNNYVAFGLGNPDVSIVSTSYMNGVGWKHVAATWDSTNGSMKLYVNGVLEGSATGGTASRNGQTALRLGALLNAPGNGAYGFTRGSLDEVRIWSKVKTQAEILANMNYNVNGREANLAEYFNFNQGIQYGNNSDVTTLYDLTPNAYNGILNAFQGLGTGGVQGNYIGGYGLNPAQYPVTATKMSIPTVSSSSSSATICGGGTTTLTATASAGAKIDWFAEATGGAALATGISNFTTPALSSTTTYYTEARDTVTGCVSLSRSAITVTVNSTPIAGILNNTLTTQLTCKTQTISLTAMSLYSPIIFENFNNGQWNNANFEQGAPSVATGSVVNGAYIDLNNSRAPLRTVSQFHPDSNHVLTVSATILFTPRSANNGFNEDIGFIATRSSGTISSANQEPVGAKMRIHNFSNGYTVFPDGYQSFLTDSFYRNPVRVTMIDNGTAVICRLVNLVTLVEYNYTAYTNVSRGDYFALSAGSTNYWDDIQISYSNPNATYSWVNGNGTSLGTSATVSITTPGTYTATVTGASGCSSTASTAITKNISTSNGDTTAFACNSFVWYGTTYTSSATPTHTLSNVFGCDSILTLHLTIGHASFGDTTAFACNSFSWYGTTYTSSANPTHVFSNSIGCDSVVTLHLTIAYSNTGDTSVIACNSFTWYGTVYTNSASPTHTFTNASGCDSLVTLHLTVGHPTTGDTTAFACNSFTWYGTTYTNSANPTRTLTNTNGCDSVITLRLTIGYSNTGDTTAVACNSFTWYGTTYTSSGNPTRTFTNASGCDSVVTLRLTITTPVNLNATTVTGIKNVCNYIGTNNTVTYTASCIGATSYAWTLPPNTMLVSGQGTAIISVKFLPGFATNANKQIRVTATTSCGVSPIRIFYTSAQAPVTPATIVASTANICGSIGTNVPVSFTIPKVYESGTNNATASSYIWTAQNGTTNITHPNGTGVNDTTIAVTFNSNFSTSSITVQSVNDCGVSAIRSYLIIRNNPTVGIISGPTNSCEFIGTQVLNATYSVSANLNINSYSWSIPSGVTNVIGQGTNTISFQYPAGYTGGAITVTGTNGCGTSAARTLTISRLLPGVPGNIDVINTQVCPNREYSYSLASIPVNATSLLWTVPAAATIVSGQGTRSITVSYTNGVVDGNVTVKTVSNCGISGIRTLIVKLAPCPATPTPQYNKEIISGLSSKMDVKVFPNPTTATFNLHVIDDVSKEIKVNIMDLQGRIIKSFITTTSKTSNIGSELNPGVYMVEVMNGEEKRVVRVVKY